jgi:nucleotide-binding universal stress UspA family protein
MAGLFLGPLVVPAAITVAHSRQPLAADVVVEAIPGAGPLSVLAGTDGSDESVAAVRQAVSLLGPRLGRLTLVAVEPIDDINEYGKQWLRQAGGALATLNPEEIVAHGEPAAVLAQLAEQGHYDLVVVGPTGRGLSPRLFGSVARALAGSAPVPVLLGSRVAAPARS